MKKRVIRLTETDIRRIVQKVIKEQAQDYLTALTRAASGPGTNEKELEELFASLKSKEDFTVKNNLKFHNIDSNNSDWKNKISSNDEALHQVIGRHLDSILGNCHYLNIQLNEGKSYSQSKYSVIFNILKDVSKKMDFLTKHLGE